MSALFRLFLVIRPHRGRVRHTVAKSTGSRALGRSWAGPRRVLETSPPARRRDSPPEERVKMIARDRGPLGSYERPIGQRILGPTVRVMIC